MLRLPLLLLILTLTKISYGDEYPVTDEGENLQIDGSGDGDDEPGDDTEEVVASGYPRQHKPLEDFSKQEDETTTTIIIAAVCLVVLAIGVIVAILLFRRHLKSREQGVYTVPAEQEHKAHV